MLFPKLEEQLDHAKQALEVAASTNVVESCKKYLALLALYRNELLKLPGTPTIETWPRDAFRTAIEHTTQERNRVTALLRSFTAVSGYEAVETLNRLKFKGRGDWKLSARGASYSRAAAGDKMTVAELVETASLLRREEHVAANSSNSSLVGRTEKHAPHFKS